jgi:hypothetical protein
MQEQNVHHWALDEPLVSSRLEMCSWVSKLKTPNTGKHVLETHTLACKVKEVQHCANQE